MLFLTLGIQHLWQGMQFITDLYCCNSLQFGQPSICFSLIYLIFKLESSSFFN